MWGRMQTVRINIQVVSRTILVGVIIAFNRIRNSIAIAA
jgi:hypothetical protein